VTPRRTPAAPAPAMATAPARSAISRPAHAWRRTTSSMPRLRAVTPRRARSRRAPGGDDGACAERRRLRRAGHRVRERATRARGDGGEPLRAGEDRDARGDAGASLRHASCKPSQALHLATRERDAAGGVGRGDAYEAVGRAALVGDAEERRRLRDSGGRQQDASVGDAYTRRSAGLARARSGCRAVRCSPDGQGHGQGQV